MLEVYKILNNSFFEGYETFIDDENSVSILSETLEIDIPSGNDPKEFTPYDTLIVAQHNNELGHRSKMNDDSLKFLMVELNAIWKVDYYSRERELLKEKTLGNLSYSDAKKEAFLGGVRIPYDIYDLYYIN